MQRFTRPWAGVLPAVLVLSACGSSAPAPGTWQGTVDTLENGRVVVQNPDVPTWDEPLVLEELFRLGTADGEGPELFGSIGGLELGPEGQVYVLDDQASEIRVFAGDGAHLRTFGREGAGPGELSNANGLVLGPDGTLWTMNWGNGRYSGYDPATGEVRREVPRPIRFASFPWPGGMDEQGRMVDVGPDEEGVMSIVRMDTAFQVAERIPLPQPDPANRIEFVRGDRPMLSMTQPFAPQPVWAPRPQGGVVAGDGTMYRVHRVSFAGDTVLTMELEREPTPVTRAERDSAIDLLQERIDELQQDERFAGLTQSSRPDPKPTKPAYGILFVDDADNTWVFGIRGPDAPPGWDVFGPDGRYRGNVEIPGQPGFSRPVVRNGRMAVVSAEDGFPAVIVYRIGPAAPGAS